jgi:hypothetical protein
MHITVLLALHGPKAGEAYRLPVLRFSADLNRVGGLLLFDSVIAPENRPSRRLSARAQRRRLSAMAPSRLSRVLMLLWIFCPFLHETSRLTYGSWEQLPYPQAARLGPNSNLSQLGSERGYLDTFTTMAYPLATMSTGSLCGT